MRVIAGRYRSRKLEAPPGNATRPTSDRLRETLFNVIAPRMPDAVFLDLFAGSGAVGIEAMSRGARQVYFVESGRKAAQYIRDNLKSLGIEEGYELQEKEALRALKGLDAAAVACDIVFLDPPYDMQEAYEECLGFLAQSRLLAPDALVIAEHEKHFALPERCGALERARKLEQGDAVLSFFRRS